MRFKSALMAAAALALSTGMAFAAGPGTKMAETGIGSVLVGPKGMTLYTFDNDTKDVSTCYDGCAVAWPPFMAAADATAEGKYTLVTRKDGKMQWAYDGMPLYFWKNDTKPGDTTGDGFKGVWHVVK